jgi:hypothetical protein
MGPTALDDYLFDLNGFLILKNAVDASHIAELNETLDAIPLLEYGQWYGNVQRLDESGVAGCELQNIVEAGEPFERLIDHPAWIRHLRHYCGEEGTYVEGLFIDECFASLRRSGGYFPMHSGGHMGIVRNQYRFINGRFRCGQVNILLALTDIGPGDGGTIVIPGSHKANLPHPEARGAESGDTGRIDHVTGACQVHLNAGDALLFVDAIAHGSSSRTNPGERRVVIYRYGPSWGRTYRGFEYSPELLARLPPERRKILQPISPRRPA